MINGPSQSGRLPDRRIPIPNNIEERLLNSDTRNSPDKKMILAIA